MKLATAAQMRELDRKAIEERKIPSVELMETAAGGVAEAVRELLPHRGKAAVFCGSGMRSLNFVAFTDGSNIA